MAEKLILPMWNEVQGYQVAQTIWKHAKAQLSAGHRMVLELREEKRKIHEASQAGRQNHGSHFSGWYRANPSGNVSE